MSIVRELLKHIYVKTVVNEVFFLNEKLSLNTLNNFMTINVT